MSREILDSVWNASGIRLIGDGVPAGDVMAAQASLTHWDEWFPYWTGLGDTYERLAREALARNRRQSAGELFWQACLSHHYAQFLWFHDPVRRDDPVRSVFGASHAFVQPVQRLVIRELALAPLFV